MLTYTAPLFPQLCNDSSYLRYWEAINHILALTSMIIGMVAIVDYKAWTPLADDGSVVFPFWPTWTAHSWLGMCTLCLWFVHMVYQAWCSLQRTFYPRNGGVEVGVGKKGYVERWHMFLGHGVYATGWLGCVLFHYPSCYSSFFFLYLNINIIISSYHHHHTTHPLTHLSHQVWPVVQRD